MDFGKWDKAAHGDSEQQKRIATAKKAATSPAAVDHENKAAEFKGSGKTPYMATLDSCTCGDFIRRKLPCKHIYRLALELEGADVQQGINKNEYAELPFDIFALPIESQKMLYDMCVASIYHGGKLFVFERNGFSEILFFKGFCIQNVPTAKILTALPVSEIKRILFSFDMGAEGLPKKTAQKKTHAAWIEDNFESVAAAVDKYFIFLEFTEHADKLKSTIHRRFTKRFERVTVDYGNDITSEHLNEVFVQDA